MATRATVVNNGSSIRVEGAESGVPGLPPFAALSTAVTENGPALDCQECHLNATMAVTLAFSVAPTAISTQLRGSFDGVNWYNMGAPITSLAAGTTVVAVTGTTFRYVQVITTITGGTGVSLTAYVGVV